MLIAKWTNTGPFAGVLQTMRQVTGPQFWRIKMRIEWGGQVDVDEVSIPNCRTPLSVLLATAQGLVKANVPDGVTVDAVRFEFHAGAR